MNTNKTEIYKNVFQLFLFLFMFAPCYSQEISSIPEWFEPAIESSHSVFEEDKEILNYNFSDIINDKRCELIGFIGDNYQKIDMSFNKVEKKSNTKYLVLGCSKVKSVQCPFSGYIEIIDVRELNEYIYGVDDFMKGQVKRQGICIARYNFEENRMQEYSGIFSGILLFRWYIDSDNKLNYDDINDDSDSYSNNQYLGEWNDYSTKKRKKCAWGQYRIPDCGDLDIGVAEFSVNPLYASSGWNVGGSSDCGELISSWYGYYSVEVDLPSVDDGVEANSVTYAIDFKPDECKYYKLQLHSNDIYDCEVITSTTDSISFRAIGEFAPNTEDKPLVTLYKKNAKFYISGPFIFGSNYTTTNLIEIEKMK